MSTNYPSGITQLEVTNLCRPGQIAGQETCAACKREMVERWTDMWYVGERRMEDQPLDAPGKQKVCSRRCLSQVVYDTAPESVKDLMRVLARVTFEWIENVSLRRTDGDANLDWALSHSYITLLLPRLSLSVTDDAMRDFLHDLVGRDCAVGGDEFPTWYENAIHGQIVPLKPAQPEEFVHRGIEVAR